MRFATVILVLLSLPQLPDSAAIYGERKDSLQESIVTASQAGNYLSRGKELKTEVISASGLTRLACCTLADSFENSASVSVGYSDATTGARQIKLLGLGGAYTQMLEETRPILRGLASPFGLSFVPSSWLESIQIAKGAPTVRNGNESMSGSINLEKRKPTDEKPLFVNASVMDDSRVDLNAVSSLQLSGKLSTAIFAHADGNFHKMDMNSDGFVDSPLSKQLNLANRWFYLADDGTALQWGVSALADSRQGGDLYTKNNPWQSDILSKQAGAFFKLGHPTSEDGSIALIADYSFAALDSQFGSGSYDASQNSFSFNLIRENKLNEANRYVYGVSGTADSYDEELSRPGAENSGKTAELTAGLYGEYSFTPLDAFSLTLGVREDYYRGNGWRTVPRLSLRFSPLEDITLRLNAGRGLRYSLPLADNFGIMSTNKTLNGLSPLEHILEDSAIAGVNLSWNISGSSSDYLSVEYFHTEFKQKLIADMHEGSTVTLAELSTIEDGRSYTDNIQADLSLEPLRGLSLGTTLRYTLAKQSRLDGTLDYTPMTPSYKAVLTARYALPLDKWIFDGTLSFNGPCKVWDFMKGLKDAEGNLLYPDGNTPVYPLVYLQVTHRMKGWDWYIGCENLTNFTQKNVLIGDTHSPTFDASQVWAPLMGRRVYAGVRVTIWKTI